MDIQINLFDYTSVRKALEKQPGARQWLLTAYAAPKGAKAPEDKAAQAQTSAEAELLACIQRFCEDVNEKLSAATPTDIYYVNAEKTESAPVLFNSKSAEGGSVNGYAGILQFKLRGATVRLNIHSRFDNMAKPDGRFLMYMFRKGAVARGQVYEDMDLSGMQIDNYWDMMMVITFLRKLETAFRAGPFRQYRDYHRNDDRLRGRIDVARHLRENPVFAGNIAYSAREYTVDNDMNRLILRTYYYLKQKYPRLLISIVSRQDAVRRGMQMLESEVENWRQGTHFDICAKTRKPIANSIYRSYEDLRQTCHAVLNTVGIDLYSHTTDGAKEKAAISGLLIDLPRLWEQFLYYAVIRAYAGFSGPYHQEHYPMIGGFRVAEPDYLIPALPSQEDEDEEMPLHANDMPLHANNMVLDAKYKLYWGNTYCTENDVTEEDLTGKNDTFQKAAARLRRKSWEKAREDVFQVLAYTLALDCQSCGVIFPLKKANFPGRSVEVYPVSHFCRDRYFARIPYLIPDDTEDPDTAFAESDRLLAEFLDQLRHPADIAAEEMMPMYGSDEDADDFPED